MSASGKEDVREVGDYQSNRELELPQSEGTKESVVVVRGLTEFLLNAGNI